MWVSRYINKRIAIKLRKVNNIGESDMAENITTDSIKLKKT